MFTQQAARLWPVLPHLKHFPVVFLTPLGQGLCWGCCIIAAAAAILQVPNSTTSEFVAHLQFVQHRAWSHTGLCSCIAVCTKLTNLLYIFKQEFCLTFLNICATDQQTPKIINVIHNIAFFLYGN